MKLNYKRTLLVGMAFFLISAFWQAYDAIIPLALTNHYGLPQSISGVVMSVDNILAVFMLPIFGALSDKVMTKMGKRTPFILVGTIAAVIAFISLTLIGSHLLSPQEFPKSINLQQNFSRALTKLLKLQEKPGMRRQLSLLSSR